MEHYGPLAYKSLGKCSYCGKTNRVLRGTNTKDFKYCMYCGKPFSPELIRRP